MAIANLAVFRSKMRGVVYILNFIFNLQLATTSYYVANYLLHLGLEDKYLSFVFAFASILAIGAFYFSSIILNKIGAYRTIFVSAIIYSLLFIALATVENITLAVFVFLLSSAPASLIVASLDALMERFTESDGETGSQRGLFITMASAAFVAGPFVGSLLVKGGDFKALWLAAFAFMIPFLVIAFWRLRKVEKLDYNKINISLTVSKLLKDKNVFNIFMAQFVLYFFYSIMVIYTSVYLKNHMHIEYEKIGIIFAIMLTPFVFLTVPLGRIADKYIGEQEMLVAGFIIMSVSTLLFALNESPLWFVIALLLFATRIGASMVQTMTESYFFKKIDGKDADILSAFRAMYPLSSIVAPLIASPILFFAGFRELYLLLSLVVASGVYFALKIEDTK